MKKLLLSLLMMFLCFGFASAAYECSDGKAFDSQSKEISENEEKEINGLGIGIMETSESGVLNKITASIIVDASKITLSNTTNSEDVVLLTGEYTVTFINISGSEARIKVEGDTEDIEERELTDVDETKVYITSIDETNNEVDLIIGIESASLSNTDNPEELITIEDIDYLIELLSASSDNAVVLVKTCSSNQIIQVTNSIVNNTNTSTSSNNTTNTTNTTNVTNQNNTNNDTETNETDITDDNPINGNTSNSLYNKWFFYIPTALIIIILGYMILNYFKKKSANTSEVKTL